uniref:Uncharacterized protein n=1 Tax=Ditylenchus dipsaci TaxID=166011 RepID=A0A915DAE3_9BILA
MMLVEHLDASGSSLLPFFQDQNTRWLNVVVPLLLYTIIQVGLIWVLYKCFVFLKARSAHDEKRRLEKQKEQTKLQVMSTSCNHPLIQRSLSDREPPAFTSHRRDSTVPKLLPLPRSCQFQGE